LGYTSASDVVELKGRVACEISTGDELLLTELLFNGVFNDLNVEQCVALLSCAVCDDRNDKAGKPREELTTPLKVLRETAKRIARIATESKLDVKEDDYINSFRTELMDVVYAWCTGAKFSEICKLTEIFEGSIIRVLRRLEELLRQMCAACRQIGNTELENKFQDGVARIKRDIVFAASLYL
jgi:ATP-dependent RNA helicase DOB1